ncbi:anti-anti-sigma factor [Thioalkalivibrio denitrificans]|uniref:Anti-anti-sigma factor n=1 Tax=Thioalkalivibrio denitrificans TaxID=108003 RepID=A0A1V3NN29_9GAMM|nr:STAS domain-containing protein [Thioalkalivibrio denitrificans]OOG26485.1 anti-anti-sigma factor [Thioalkalivibrio denitrificans]
MSATPSIRQADGNLQVAGRLGFATVADLWAQALPLFRDGSGAYELDVSGVEHVDSAGVALLVEWMRLARERGAGFSIVGAPQAMKDLIRLADLEGLLPVTSFRQDPA